MSSEPLLPVTLGNNSTHSPNSISCPIINLMPINTQTASVQVDPSLGVHELVSAKNQMLAGFLLDKRYLNTIIVFLDITRRRPWCGRIGLKWLLSEQQQKYLAQLACHLFFNMPPPEVTPVLFNGFGHIEETNFDEVMAVFLSEGVKECGKYVFTNNVSKLAVSCIIASHIVRGFMMIFP